MTRIRRRRYTPKYLHTPTLPEKYGGSLLFRARYLESRWVRFIFHTLVFGAALMMLLTGVAGKVDQWQTDYRTTVLSRVEAGMNTAISDEEKSLLDNSLTGQAEAVLRQTALLEEKLLFLPADAESKRSGAELQLEMAEARLSDLQQAISDTYLAAETAYAAGTAAGQLEAMRLFAMVEGFSDADGWLKLCSSRLHWQIADKLARGEVLTAFVLQRQLLERLYPEKVRFFYADLTPLRGRWVCREDQEALISIIADDRGDGRAGKPVYIDTGQTVRCLRVYRDAVYGAEIEGYPGELRDSDFTELIARGGIDRVLPANVAETDPAACGLTLRQEMESELEQIEIISENIIRITDGSWTGTYYREISLSEPDQEV